MIEEKVVSAASVRPGVRLSPWGRFQDAVPTLDHTLKVEHVTHTHTHTHTHKQNTLV